MGYLHRGDEDLHYSDSSHRWIAPPDIDQELWEAGMRAHMKMHSVEQPGQAPRSPRDGTPPPATEYMPPPTT